MTLTSNEKILDHYIRHQIYILRYTGGLRNEVSPLLSETNTKLRDTILSYTSRINDRTFTGKKGREWQRSFEKAITDIRLPAWKDINTEVNEQLKDFVVSEAIHGATVIEGSLPVVLNISIPPVNQLISIVNSQPFEGKTLKQWLEKTAQSDIERIVNSAKIGITQGITPIEITKSIVGPKGRAQKAFHDLESLLLTVTNGIQQEAKQALYAANGDIVEYEMFVATLDARTTLICASNDNKKFKRGEGPIPPLHFRCRSLRVPYIDPEIGASRPFNPTTEKQLLKEYAEANDLQSVNKRGSLPYGHKTKFDQFARKRKRELIGQIPANTSYNDWLKTQSNDFQNTVLGSTRAKMFRDGNITLDKFVTRDGTTLTLNELKKDGFDVPNL